jgi:hypothetical protein
MVGNPGTGKSASFKAKIDEENHHLINSARLTAFQLYKMLFRMRNKAIILDDVDDALRRSDMARLLMSLCESDNAARTVAWLGTESLLKTKKEKKDVRVPQEFETTSRVCVICNDWGILTTKFGALLDRGTIVFFDPDAAEIHRVVGQHLADIPQHSIRYYINARDHKRLGLDWKAALRESWTSDLTRGDAAGKLVQRLLADTTYQSDQERIATFVAHADGGSRRTWFNLKKKLRTGTNGKPQR